MDISKATVEGVICLFDEQDELIGIVRKNGDVIFYKTDKMGFDNVAHLLGAHMPATPK